jgi:hypothetical protein
MINYVFRMDSFNINIILDCTFFKICQNIKFDESRNVRSHRNNIKLISNILDYTSIVLNLSGQKLFHILFIKYGRLNEIIIGNVYPTIVGFDEATDDILTTLLKV